MIKSEEKQFTYLQKYQQDTRKTLKVLEEMEGNPKLFNNFNEMLSETVERSCDLQIVGVDEDGIKRFTQKLLEVSESFPEQFQDAFWNSVALVFRNYPLEFIGLPFFAEKEIERFVGKDNLESFLDCVEKDSVGDYHSFLLDIFQSERGAWDFGCDVVVILKDLFKSLKEYLFVLNNTKKEFSWFEDVDVSDYKEGNFLPPNSQIILSLKTIINCYQVDEIFYLWAKLFKFVIKSKVLDII